MTELCTWIEDENGPWQGCGQKYFNFNEGGPVENGFKFCPYCGKPIDEYAFDYEEAAAERQAPVWTARSPSDPYCVNCGLTWDMHIAGSNRCPDRAVQEQTHWRCKDHGAFMSAWNKCPECGLLGTAVETHGPCGWDEPDRGP